jgi:multiple sugar transport system substrate-binding protein
MKQARASTREPAELASKEASMKRLWRRGLSLALAGSCALGAATQIAAGAPRSAAAPGGASAPVTIEFWNYWDGNNAKAISDLISRFNRTHPNIRVKNVTFPWGNLFEKMQVARAGGDLPPVAAGDIAWMANLNRSGALVDITATVRRNVNTNDFYPELLRYGRYRGKIQALPVSTNNLALFYNKDLFQRAGLNPNRPPQTWEQVREYAKRIAALGGGVQGFEIFTQPGEGLTWQFQPYLWQAGAEYLVPPKYDRPGFNNPRGRRALTYLVNLIQTDKVAEAGQWGAFDKGLAGMRVDGSWMVSIYADQAPFQFGTSMIPTCAGCKRATNMGGEQVFVFKSTSAKQKAATTFAIWLASTKTQIDWDVATAFMPVRKSVAGSRRIQGLLSRDNRYRAFIRQQKYAHARPPIPQYPATSEAFSREIEKAFHGTVSVSQALVNADRAVRAALRGR